MTPGHVLVVPLRKECISLSDLTAEENKDYFATLQLVHQFIKSEFQADSLNIAIQDGPEAGQTVPHLHTHIIPRYKQNNIGDKIYENLDSWSFEDQLLDWDKRRDEYTGFGGRVARKELAKPDDQRVERTQDDLFQEAEQLTAKLDAFLAKHPYLREY